MLIISPPTDPGCQACCSGEPFPTEVQQEITAVTL